MAEGTITLDESAIKDRHVAATAQIARSKLEQRILGIDAIDHQNWRVWDALHTNLPGTPAADDLGLVTGTWGTDAPYIGTGDVKASNTTRRAATIVTLPEDYEAAQTVNIVVTAGMKTTTSDGTATVDIEVWRLDEDGTLGAADICATAAQSINNLTAADKTFTITATTLLPGDQLYIRLTVAVNDTATVTAVIGAVYKVEVQSDRR